MSTTTPTPSADDITALRKLVEGVRTSWRTVVMIDVLTDETITLKNPDDSFLLEYWTIDGRSGVTLPETRKRVLRDTLTEEPVGAHDPLMQVTWVDADQDEHEAYLTEASIRQLQKALDRQADEIGEAWDHGEIHGSCLYAEPGSKRDAVLAVMRAYAGK